MKNAPRSVMGPGMLATTLTAAVMSLSPAMAQAQNAANVPAEGFLCCNMRTDGSWISDINYEESGKRIIPAGTPVKFIGFGRYRVETKMNGESQWLGNDYSRELDMETFARRYILDRDPKTVIAKASPKIRVAIESAKVAKGMTREQVVMAVGYPVSSENPDLNASRWKFWLWSYSPFTVNFDGKGRVTSVESDADTLPKVYVP